MKLTRQQRDYVDTFLRTGHAEDTQATPWPGQNILESSKAERAALRDALVAEVRRRAQDVVLPSIHAHGELRAMTRRRVEPMVRGLFPKVEREKVLELLEKAVVFLTPDNVTDVLHDQSFDHSAWTIANLYLHSVDAELLGDEAPELLGLSQETTCFVTAWYLEGRGKFEDFLVHEAAHVFHNWKREYAGLPHTRYKDWLLPIEFKKREMFAYGCEVYARIVEQSRTAKEREVLLDEYAEHPYVGGEDVDEHLDILREAVGARNGWKRILSRCAPPKRRDMEITVTSNLPELRGVFPWERELLATRADELLRAIQPATQDSEEP